MIQRVLDLFFPPLCEICRTTLSHGRSLCPPCADSLPRITAPFCSTCGEAYEGQINEDFHCTNCASMKVAYDFARSPLAADGTARQLIHGLKYQQKFFLARELAPFLVEVLNNDPRLQNLPSNTIISPVPLHWTREQKRQGNQAHEIAKAFSSISSIPILSVLKRTRKTETQTQLTRKQRLLNLKNAFSINPSTLPKIKDATILLIDDVFTTGSTAHECARVLKKEGQALSVIVLTILRG